MKRTKPSSLPTRIMPRRGKTRQNTASDVNAGENSQQEAPPVDGDRPQNASSRSESQLGTETSPSTSTRGRNSSHRKRKRLHRENIASSETTQANEASTSASNRSGRESPEQACSICLCAVENRAFTDACYHTFCFECLVEWSKVRAVCPLCKKSFHSIIHSFRSYDDYKLYQVPRGYVPNSVNMNNSSVNANNVPLPASLSFTTRVDMLLPASLSFSTRVGQFFNNSSNPPIVSSINDDRLLEVRRRVYANSDEMQLVGLWSSNGVVMPPANQVSPAMFDCYPVMLERVRPWVLRDVAAIAGGGHIQTIADIVLQLLRQFPITSDDFYERLFPYLGLHTRRFLLELDVFARSPLDMNTYDARVIYGAGAGGSAAEPTSHLLTEHVEDISSSDDSDIELLSPAEASTSDSAHNRDVSALTDHVVPDLLSSLRTLQHRLFMSFSDMSRRSLNSGLESPVPGPSGLGQQIVAASGESESVGSGSHTSMLAHDGEDRSDSPMILSDAESDIVVVDVSRSVRSPIHISSGEDDIAAQQIRARRRIKRRRRHSRHAEKHRRESEQNDVLAVGTERAEGPQSESHIDKPSGYFLESNPEELLPAVEQNESSSHSHALEPSSSRCSSAQLNNHSSACSQPSPSKSYEAGKSADTAMHSLHRHPHLKRSLSANSIGTVSVVSESSSGDVKPVTCKKHVSGHKSSKSKQRMRELMAEKRSTEGISGNAEKVGSGNQDGEVIGNGENAEQVSADVPNEATASSVGESSAACQDISSDALPVCHTSETPTGEQKLLTNSQPDDETVTACIGEVCSLPADSIFSPSMEGNQCSPVELIYETADQQLSIAAESPNSCNENAGVGSCDVVPMHTVDADEQLLEPSSSQANASGVADESSNIVNGDVETCTASVSFPDCIPLSNVNRDESASVAEHFGSRDDNVTGCLPPFTDLLPLSGPVPTSDCSECSSESVGNSGILTTKIAGSCISDNKIISVNSESVDQGDSSADFPVVRQESETQMSTNQSSHPELFRFFNQDTSSLHTDAASSASLSSESSAPSCTFSSSVSQMSSDCSYGERHQPAGCSSTSRGDLVIEEIVIGSPVGIDDDSSDSEVEWLGTSRRQRCISVSSSDSSVLCSPSDSDDVESVLSDSDSLEIFDSEPQPSESAELICSYPAPSQPLSPLSSASLPSTPDMSSTSVDISSEQVPLELHDAVEASTSVELFAGDFAVQNDTDVDAFSPASGVDSNAIPAEELVVQQ